MTNSKQIIEIKPWWLRLIILLSIGIPVLTGWPVNIATESIKEILPVTPEMANIFVWMVYACFIWLVVFLSAGEKKLLEYLAIAFMLGLTTSISGATTWSTRRSFCAWAPASRSQRRRGASTACVRCRRVPTRCQTP